MFGIYGVDLVAEKYIAAPPQRRLLPDTYVAVLKKKYIHAYPE
jgi:hypothetical protein